MNRPYLPLLVMGLGGGCMLLGLFFLGLRLVAPDTAAQVLPSTATPIPPTQGFLLAAPLPPPPRVEAAIPIMPIMEVLPLTTEVAALPPSATSSSSPSASPPSRPSAQAASASPPPPTASAPPPSPTFVPLITFTPSPSPIPRQPARILIPAIQLDAPVIPVWLQQVALNEGVFSQWRVPETRAAGWHETSARLGQAGNTVLNGHHNVHGHVFRDLIEVEVGDTLRLVADDDFGLEYTVVQTMLLEEEGRSLEERLENARWLLPSSDERITLVTCWPPDGQSHRLVVVALPKQEIEQHD